MSREGAELAPVAVELLVQVALDSDVSCGRPWMKRELAYVFAVEVEVPFGSLLHDLVSSG